MPVGMLQRSPTERIIGRIDAIATLPEVTTRIMRVVDDPDSDAGDLERIISHDPALVARVLKSINSSFYSLSQRINSVSRAISLLGFNAVEKLAIAASMGQIFKGVKPCDGFSTRDLWTHSVAVGVIAREIAREMAPPLAEEAFLGGLIHDVGLLAELQARPADMQQVCELAKTHRMTFTQLEREILGTDHEQVGESLAKQWSFPRPCQLVAGMHHPPAAPREEQMLIALVRAADTLCCGERMGFYLTARHQQLDGPGLESLRLTPLIIERLRRDMSTLVWTAMTIFE